MGQKAAPSTSAKKPAKKSGNKPAEDDYVANGEAAFADLEPMLLALPSDRLRYVNVDVQVAAITARGVARAIEKDAALKARFEALAAAKEFERSHLAGLETAALAFVRGGADDRSIGMVPQRFLGSFRSAGEPTRRRRQR